MDLNSLRRPTVILKFVEIGLLIIIMALYFSQSYYITIYHHTWSQFVASVIVGAFINALALLVVLMLGYDQIQKTPLELLLYGYYTMATFISSILLFTVGNGICTAAAVFKLVLMLIYAAEIYFCFCSLVGRPVSFPATANPTLPPQVVFPPSRPTFPTEAYPPPASYPAAGQMHNVDLGSSNDARYLQQL